MMERLETSLSEVISRRHMKTTRRRCNPFDVSEAVDIMTKIALCMKFLHSREIVHGGLSTDIVVMNGHREKDFDFKIAGFAFSDYANCNSLTVSPHQCHSRTGDKLDPPIRVSKAGDNNSFASICYAVLMRREYLLPCHYGNPTHERILQSMAFWPGFSPILITAWWSFCSSVGTLKQSTDLSFR